MAASADVGRAYGASLTRNKMSNIHTQQQTDIEQLAVEQGVCPVTDFESLLGDFWPEDESADEFIAQVRAWRREDGARRDL